ncbi:MAG: translation initiation factor IF-2 subunit gamma [Candidatus Diapherotrites archaeon CG08_land_8_20_14_0_20_34_12]|nr:MAG: translation initiation factor IF-2 subunit gamma [Candidatus Diapherotrites archaeon CG08_land_8_20_14_0_20_34_12]
MKEVKHKEKEVKDAKEAKELLQPEANIGMIGHVDSGKTSLVRAITGVWTDTHSEELKRGISIRIGYADVDIYKCPKCRTEHYSIDKTCPNCKGKSEYLRTVSFVDAPGHETLMMTMLSGAILMDGAILVIAANEECPQPQTIEHIAAITINGVKNLIIAQNKIDLVSKEEALKNYKQIKDFLAKTPYKDAPIIPTAANLRGNLSYLLEAIEEYIPTPKYELNKPMKMFCVRSFDINRPGTKVKDLRGGVLGGSILQGKLNVGDKVEILPGMDNKKFLTEVRGISTSKGKIKTTRAGGLLAIETALDPSIASNDKFRGQIIAAPGLLNDSVKSIEFEFNQLDRTLINEDYTLVINEQIVLVIGAMPVVGIIKNIKGKNISCVLNHAMVVEKGQKIAISKRKSLKWRLIGYGIVK